MIFSNTTPLIALAGVQHLDLLPALFGEIHVVESGIYYHSALVRKLTAVAGEVGA